MTTVAVFHVLVDLKLIKTASDYSGKVFIYRKYYLLNIIIVFITTPRPAANRLAGCLGVVKNKILILNRRYLALSVWITEYLYYTAILGQPNFRLAVKDVSTVFG